MTARPVVRWLVLLTTVAVSAAACTAEVDLQGSVELTDTSAGWYDAGITDGKNKIVPSVTFRLRKKPHTEVDRVSVNVVFRHPPPPGAADEEEWGEVFIQTAEFTDNSQTPPLTARTENGYTGEPPQSRMDLLNNSHFRDVRAHVFVKYGSGQWVDVGTIDVPRQLITRSTT